ncbi:MAG: amino acid permease [Clostridia bacterium]|nr:amino acid permease [Clostridia bacterium]
MVNKKGGLSAIQLTMMAVGTVIGGSFFLGTAIPIKSAGPSIIISYVLGGALVYFILFALSEMTVADAHPGSFRTFSQREFGPAVGFVTGWVYWTGLVLAMSSEAIAVSIFFRLWFPGVSVPVLGSLIIILITLANLLGAEHLSRLESSLAGVKVFAIAAFIVIAMALVFGFFPGKPAAGYELMDAQPFLSGGMTGIAGSMLIVMFSYAGFEIIGLAASEAREPVKTIPKAILYTVLTLTILYICAIAFVLPLIPIENISEEVSPFVAALEYRGIRWAAGAINIVLVTAIISTMLAATFGLGRMMRSLTDEGHAPAWIKDSGEVPYRGILFSGSAMLIGLGMSFFLPREVYIFLVSSGGFSLLFTYLIILLTHNKFRKNHGCPPRGKCQLPLFPYTSWAAIIAVTGIIVSMPLVPGQGLGLAAGIILLVFYSICYMVIRYMKRKRLKYAGR